MHKGAFFRVVTDPFLVFCDSDIGCFMLHWATCLTRTRGVLYCGLAIYLKQYLKAKEQLCKLKYFTMQKCNLQKNPLKETKILQDTTTLTNLKFQHKPKYHVSKILI
jgi:hypothetical protein